MAPSVYNDGLSPSAQIVRDVFKVCISSMEDLSETESFSVAASSAADLVKFLAARTGSPQHVRDTLQGLADLCRSHIQVVDQNNLPEPANQNR